MILIILLNYDQRERLNAQSAFVAGAGLDDFEL